jgi:hypothetical protein
MGRSRREGHTKCKKNRNEQWAIQYKSFHALLLSLILGIVYSKKARKKRNMLSSNIISFMSYCLESCGAVPHFRLDAQNVTAPPVADWISASESSVELFD